MASSKVAMSGQGYGGGLGSRGASGGWRVMASRVSELSPWGALILILAVQGAEIGLSSVSSWISDSAQALRVSAGEIVWLVLAQLVASSMDGYLAGRLRTKWVSLHTHEIYFRDTVHGFLA